VQLDYALSSCPEKLSLGIRSMAIIGSPAHCKSTCAARIPSTDKPNPSAEYIATDDALISQAYGAA